MKNSLYIIYTVLALASCEMRFELDIPQEDSKIFAFCVPGARDSTAILVDIARFTGDSITLDRSKIEIDLRVNGERQKVMYQPKNTFPYISSDHSIPEESFYITRKLKSDDIVSLDISYPGLESVSAVTTIPDKPVDAVFKVEADKNSGSAKFILEYSDSSEDTYYAVIFRERLHEFIVSGFIEEDGEVIADTLDNIDWQPHHISHEFDAYQSTESNFEAYNNRAGLLFWKNSDALDKDGLKTVFFRTSIMHDVENWYTDLNHSHFDFSYEATIYRITEELYKFYLTNLLVNENSLSYFGLSRNNATFTNISNGFGILGGMAGHTMMYDTTISDKENYLPEVY